MSAALAGLRALDLSQTLAGAQATQLLADFGAEVVLVEPPGGSRLRAQAAWPFWARGKRSIALDLAADADRAVARGLAREADVLLETWRPGVAERLGLGFEELAARNPRLVYASITGFGRSGPLAGLKAYEGIAMAKLGAFSAQAQLSARPGPSFLAAPYCSFSAAQLALQGILAALVERERSGLGQRVETTLAQGLLAHDTWNWLLRHVARKHPGAFKAARPISENLVPNSPLLFRLLVALTADGRWLQFSQVTDPLFRAFLRAAGLERLLSDPVWKDAASSEDESLREAYWEQLLRAVREKSYHEWSRIFDAEPDIWAERFRRGPELLDHPQLRHDGQVVEIHDPVLGPVEQPGPLVAMSATPARALRPAPALDADAAALRARAAAAGGAPSATPPDLDAAPAAADAAADGRPPLDGVTVLELGTFFAAPYGATLLADLGARVLKVEPLAGDPIRWLVPFPELAGVKVLQGKESLAVDLARPEGREIAYALARRSQLVLRSFRAGVAERLALDAASLLRVNPDLVYLDAPGYGVDGPCGHRPAFAPTIGAGSGLSARNVGSSVPERADLTLEELKRGAVRLSLAGTGIAHSDGFAALGVATALLLGLVARMRGAPGQRLLTTMLATTAHALSEDMLRYPGRPPAPASDPELYGFGALYRIHRAADAWLFLAVTSPAEWSELCALAPFAALGRDARFATPRARERHDAALAAELGAVFATRNAADWERELGAADVACAVCAPGPVEAAITDPGGLARACGFVTEVEHPILERHPRLVPPYRFSRSRGVAAAGCTVGQHTGSVLRELGYADARIAELRAKGVIGG